MKRKGPRTPPPVNRPALLTYAEAAHYLDIAPGTLMHWVSAGRIGAVRLSQRRIRFTIAGLDAFIRENTTEAR